MGDPRSVPEIGAADLFTPVQIARVRASDLGNWAGYSAVLTSRREVGALVAQQPELKAGLDAFVDAHR